MGAKRIETERITPNTLVQAGAVYEALGKAFITRAKALYRLARELPRTWALEVPDVTGLDGDGI